MLPACVRGRRRRASRSIAGGRSWCVDLDRVEGIFGGRFAAGFRPDEPWDSQNNRKLHELSTYTFWRCPSHPNGGRSNDTHFVAVVGPGTIFPSDGTSRRLSDVKDGPGDTLIVVEVLNAGIHWMEPKELYWDEMSFRLNDQSRPSMSGNHPLWTHRLSRTPRAYRGWHGDPSPGESHPRNAEGLAHDRRRGEDQTRGLGRTGVKACDSLRG